MAYLPSLVLTLEFVFMISFGSNLLVHKKYFLRALNLGLYGNTFQNSASKFQGIKVMADSGIDFLPLYTVGSCFILTYMVTLVST